MPVTAIANPISQKPLDDLVQLAITVEAAKKE